MLILVAAFNLLGDGINLALNPQLRTRGGAPKRQRLVPPPVNEAPAPGDALLRVEDLRLVYRLPDREVRAVDGVSLAIPKGGSLGIVGESGCGKSSLGAALMQVLPSNAELTGGNVYFDGKAVLLGGRPVGEGGRSRFQALRWTRLSMIFQSAMNALNPVLTVRQQLTEAYLLHRPSASNAEAEKRIEGVFDMIGIARSRMASYPHELSGGMRQRAMIALSLLLEPELVVADEPTTALDVLIQDQILAEIDNLRRRMNLTLILVSHDIGTVAETCETVAVMYAGQIVETAPTSMIFDRPGHPYTRALIDALPDLTGPKKKLAALPGEPFVPSGDVVGCRFAPRCKHATHFCKEVTPPQMVLAADHRAACHYAEKFAEPRLLEFAS
jgi:peptide/nickel transport system permease protein